MPVYPFGGIIPTIDPTAFVHPDAIVIGNVHIGPGSSVWPGAVIRGDVHFIHIGAGTNVQDGAVLHVSRATALKPDGLPLRIGDNVVIGHNVTLHACTIGNDCMIGIGAIVLDGAVVEASAILGAGAMLPPGKTVITKELWVGAPAKRLRELSPEEIQAIEATAESYRQLAKSYAIALTAQILH
ncbi:MAG: gamma carbonic anhydrase family protein [Magnetococcales bacterium]|nr:gamma carbonic anhydrase family protein [Magnetococcales bacterium]MBF0437900.1 gamma carbonic anhydrase family protein [Magnetococcales bacterium]